MCAADIVIRKTKLVTFFVTALVLAAALIHATWNALLRSGADRYWSVTVMNIAAATSAIPFLIVLPLPAASAWPYILFSTVIHIGYCLFLIQAYSHGEFGQVYPIARGTSPLLTTCGGLLLAGQHLDLSGWIGVALISAGIISLTQWKSHPNLKALATAFGTGLFIAGYSVTDGIGVRLSGNAVSYSVWLMALLGVSMMAIYAARRGTMIRISLRDIETKKAVISGIISWFGYAIIIWAMKYAPMGTVSALRETSVVFAALIARFFFHERLTKTRLAACSVIAAGAVLIG